VILPNVGLSPVIPHSAAGMRMLPPVSVPSAAKHSPAATDAPDPELDPPVIRPVSQGFLAAP
jgi:hypothetical protein